jgi:hypothetical protein
MERFSSRWICFRRLGQIIGEMKGCSATRKNLRGGKPFLADMKMSSSGWKDRHRRVLILDRMKTFSAEKINVRQDRYFHAAMN